jgi:hypothetical protein
MKFQQYRSHLRRLSRFTPHVEGLEHRLCPSVASITVVNHTMIIAGDNGADDVQIRDDGLGDVSAKITTGSTVITGSGQDIRYIKVLTNNGSDNVHFVLTGSLTTNLGLKVDLGTGADNVLLDFSDGVATKHLGVYVDGGSGAEQLTTRFGAIDNSNVYLHEDLGHGIDTSNIDFGGAITSSKVGVDLDGSKGTALVNAHLGDVADSTVYFASNLGQGGDSFTAGLNGNVTDSSKVYFDVDGGRGADSMAVNVNGNIDATSKVGVQFNGGKSGDSESFHYNGQLDGTLNYYAHGGAGSDIETGIITIAQGSTGTLNAVEHGGPGNDLLTLNVYDNSNPGGSSTLTDLDAYLVGGGGNDTFIHTPNVIVK